ncbi:hypothetical protein D3C87_1603650 [compost metagenome]
MRFNSSSKNRTRVDRLVSASLVSPMNLARSGSVDLCAYWRKANEPMRPVRSPSVSLSLIALINWPDLVRSASLPL